MTLMAGALFNHHEASETFPGFFEVIYLVTRPDLVKTGLGAKVLRNLKKELARRDGKFIVAFADLNAVEFFTKQGFKLLEPKSRQPKRQKLSKGPEAIDEMFFDELGFSAEAIKDRVEHYRRASLMVWEPGMPSTCTADDSSSAWSRKYSAKLGAKRQKKYDEKENRQSQLVLRRRNSHLSTSGRSEKSIAATVRSRTSRRSALVDTKAFESYQIDVPRSKDSTGKLPKNGGLRQILAAMRNSRHFSNDLNQYR